MRIWQQIFELLQQQETCALISVVEVKGSTPREVGAQILLSATGGFYGTIGGGNMENKSILLAQQLLAKGGQKLHIESHILGPDFGQCCGGAVKIMIEIFDQTDFDNAKAFARFEADGAFNLQISTDGNCISRLKASQNIEHFGLQDDGGIILQYGLKNAVIYLFGAGHVGKALMLQLAVLPFDVVWVDSRKGEFPRAVPANFTLIHQEKPQDALASAPDGAQIFILTHDHDIDFNIVYAALNMRRFSYIGVIGSKTKGARFVSKLRKLDFTERQINEMHCPIGIGIIGSKKPAAIAVSVAAEILSRVEI